MSSGEALIRRSFATREALAQGLAEDVARQLPGRLAVSGGTTPKLFFHYLSRQPAAWDATTVTLVDERQVPETSARSNARLVRDNLLVANAAAANFEPLTRASPPSRFAAVILGMGSDGHTASFFPNGTRLAEAIDPQGPARVVDMEAPDAGEPRLTFTLPALLDTGFLALHIEGDEKARVLEKALGAGAIEEMPIRAVLRSGRPLAVYWAP